MMTDVMQPPVAMRASISLISQKSSPCQICTGILYQRGQLKKKKNSKVKPVKVKGYDKKEFPRQKTETLY